MRCHYLSDLHLEAQSFEAPLPRGDVLIIAGDLCHACCLDPSRMDRYSVEQRERVRRFVDGALSHFGNVLFVAGNHEPYDGIYEETTNLLRRHLPGVEVLDNNAVEIHGIRFFGATLWTDFDAGSMDAMNRVRRRMGEFFFVKTRLGSDDGTLTKFQPEHAKTAHDMARAALSAAIADGGPMVVITHHAPSRLGLNPRFVGNGIDAAYASDLDDMIAGLGNVPVWVHGHTHVARTYRIGRTEFRSNAHGFASKGQAAPGFSVKACFEL
ncbi:MAG: metallophosphoesterase [Thermomicrobiales bacterium]